GRPGLTAGAYGGDDLPRNHPLRRLRLELRREGRARELAIEPFDQAATGQLAARVLGQAASPALEAMVHARTQGLPFFVEELVAALATSGRLQVTPRDRKSTR